jgi:hypothetical protein
MQVGRWRALLIVYRELNVRLRHRRWFARQYRHVATKHEIADATESFRAFPRLAAELSSGAAEVTTEIVVIDSPLRSLTADGDCYWPSPDDTRREVDELSPAGSHDSIFIFWPQSDSAEGTSIACRGWGLGMGASDWSNGATYAVIGNAPTWMWQREAPGEVWLHEWLHGVCAHFASRGYPMPERDADGAEVHGYVRSSTKGWTSYYRDLMTGSVSENGRLVGIPLVAWGAAAEQQSRLSA